MPWPEEGVHPGATRAKVLDWLEFAWKVSSREIKPDTFLRDINNATLKGALRMHSGGSRDLYILGRQDKLLPYLHHVAFGSVLHTVQDSFGWSSCLAGDVSSKRHVSGHWPGTAQARIVRFHTYGAQDGGLHDEQDSREAMTRMSAAEKWPDAVGLTRNLSRFYEDRAQWSEVQPYMQCLFELAVERNDSSPGEQYRRR